jgi:ATP-dependent DNA helicase RecQ
VGAYHAGLRRAERDVVQADFLANDLDVVVATTAFGMGIDKPDVRRVVHYDIPGSLDDYYQQIGRAGRDGDPAGARLLFDDTDLGVHKFFKVRDRVNIGVVEQVLAVVGSSSTPVPRKVVGEQVGGGPRSVTAALATLARVGGVRLTDGGSTVERLGDPRQALERVIADDASNQRLQQSRIDMMHGYAETRSCRRQYLLAYFGESYDPPCGGCDVCRRDAEAASTDGHGGTQQRATRPWPVHGTVVHDAFGAGEVMGYEGDVVTILFAEHGYKTLSVPSLVERRLVH